VTVDVEKTASDLVPCHWNEIAEQEEIESDRDEIKYKISHYYEDCSEGILAKLKIDEYRLSTV